MKIYDYLIVGAGLFGATFAHQMGLKDKKCLVIDKRPHIAGNLYCENIAGINVHFYGAHIFHTSDEEVWEYVTGLVKFNHYINSPLANFNGELFNLPFNMNTFYQLWEVKTPQEARKKIEQEVSKYRNVEPKNLEEQALKLVGEDIYLKLIKGYTEKQWGRKATDMPAFIIKRLPLRFTFDNNYFNDIYQGIPIGGYNVLIEKMLSKADVNINANFFERRKEYESSAKMIVYTGMIDEYFSYCFGKLDYRSLEFKHQLLDANNYQGNAVVNYTDMETPYTRIIEHKHFEFGSQEKTVITKEYPQEWEKDKEAYYPINDKKNNAIFEQYKSKAISLSNVIFGGRLADYAYYDMDKTIKKALDISKATK